MSSLYTRKDRNKLCVAWHNPKGIRHTKLFPINQLRKAKRFAAEIELGSSDVANHGIDIETAITYFLEDRRAVRAARTFERYHNILQQFLSFVCPDEQRRPLAGVTPLEMQTWRNLRLTERTAWTVRVDLKIVRAFYSWCVKRGWAKDNTAALVDLPAPKRRFPRYLLPDQVNELLATLRQESPSELYPIALFAARAGLRRTEILFLQWHHVDLDRRIICVHGKSKEPRAVPMHEEVRSVLLDWPRRSESIFPAVYNVESNVRSPAIVKRFNGWLKRSGYSISLHGLRHSFASELAAHGLSAVALMELMGHASLRTTQIYTHAMLQHSRSYVERLGAPIASDQSQSTFFAKPV